MEIPSTTTTLSCRKATVILLAWRRRLNLSHLYPQQKPGHNRIIFVGPCELIEDERMIDEMHHVEGPISTHDENHSALMEKGRELCASVCSAKGQLALITFERRLQYELAGLRVEFDVEGVQPEQLDQLHHRRDLRAVCRRGGLQTLKCCSMTAKMPGGVSAWANCAMNQVGQYPLFISSAVEEAEEVAGRKASGAAGSCSAVVRNTDELEQWIRRNSQFPGQEEDMYIVEECLEGKGGHEFLAVASSTTGLVATIASVDSTRTFYQCVNLAETPYAMEYMTAEQTRDQLPGLESFITQVLKMPLLSRQFYPLLFIKGHYESHNDITLFSASMEMPSKSADLLFREANNGHGWESAALENLSKFIRLERRSSSATSRASINGSFSVAPQKHYLLVNFPKVDGILLHQTTIQQPPGESEMRVAWRVGEGERLLVANCVDDNVLQVFLSNPDRSALLTDLQILEANVDVHVDRSPVFEIPKPQLHYSKCLREEKRQNSAGYPDDVEGETSHAHLARAYTTRN